MAECGSVISANFAAGAISARADSTSSRDFGGGQGLTSRYSPVPFPVVKKDPSQAQYLDNGFDTGMDM